MSLSRSRSRAGQGADESYKTNTQSLLYHPAPMYVDKRKSEINSNQCRWLFGAVSWRVFTVTALYRLAHTGTSFSEKLLVCKTHILKYFFAYSLHKKCSPYAGIYTEHMSCNSSDQSLSNILFLNNLNALITFFESLPSR